MRKEKKDADLERGLQIAETIQDSLTQRLMRKLGKNDPFSKDAFRVLKEIRKMQFRYYRVKNHSLLRYIDGTVKSDGTFKRRLSKQNWRKFKKQRDRKKLKNLDEFND